MGKGDILRLTVEGWAFSQVGATSKVLIGTDPRGREGEYITSVDGQPSITTELKIQVPFQISK